MIFHQTFLDKTPETFNTINVHFAGSEVFTVVNLEITVNTEYKRINAVTLMTN